METLLTTKDNPWNPFTNWSEWLRYDIEKGYYTCEKIDRLTPISDLLPPTIKKEIIDDAMNQLVRLGAYNKEGQFVEYVKISNNSVNPKP